MRHVALIAWFCVGLSSIPLAGEIAQAQNAEKRYVRIAPIKQYLMDRKAEITLARSAALSQLTQEAGK